MARTDNAPKPETPARTDVAPNPPSPAEVGSPATPEAPPGGLLSPPAAPPALDPRGALGDPSAARLEAFSRDASGDLSRGHASTADRPKVEVGAKARVIPTQSEGIPDPEQIRPRAVMGGLSFPNDGVVPGTTPMTPDHANPLATPEQRRASIVDAAHAADLGAHKTHLDSRRAEREEELRQRGVGESVVEGRPEGLPSDL